MLRLGLRMGRYGSGMGLALLVSSTLGPVGDGPGPILVQYRRPYGTGVGIAHPRRGPWDGFRPLNPVGVGASTDLPCFSFKTL
jgi:hypothetical protein